MDNVKKINKMQTFEAQLRDLILKEEINQPLVFRGVHKKWEPCTWTLDDWGRLFKDERLTVRYGRKDWDGLQPQWESECGKTELKWKEIVDWQNGEYEFEGGKPEDAWIYYDYRYLPDVFNSGSTKDDRDRDFLKVITFNENLKKKFCWSKLGFPDRNSDHSTLWIGSSGSYTPCHYDTYSCNLICQIFGRKRWILFPPKDTSNLLVTRIPYEESSVYSRINFNSKKRIESHAQELEKCTPYQITLEAGDCLYLPAKWWHFVQSEDFSISVNTWIELPGDYTARLEEAILRTVTSTVVNMTAFPDVAKQILNPNEMDVADMSEMDLNELLQAASSSYIENQRTKMLHTPDSDNAESTIESSAPPLKKSKNSQLTLPEFLQRYPKVVEALLPKNYQTLLQNYTEESDNGIRNNVVVSRSPSYLEHLINAIGHPSILRQISEQFLQKVTSNPPK